MQPDFKTGCNGKYQPTKKFPLFAEVNISKEDAMVNKNRHTGGSHFPYLKLTYPNGVSLTLPTDIGNKQLESFIRKKM